MGNQHRLVVASDTNLERAEALARAAGGALTASDWRTVVSRSDVDTVIVCTTHNHLAPITLAAIESGKHVLVEKPAACHSQELDPLIAAAKRHRTCVEVGFNLRFHPAMRKAREIVSAGELGSLTTIRARYGHGGHVGYERTWRSDPAQSGGGELIDQGIHVIDLSRWFLGEFVSVTGFIANYFWQRSVEDNAFLLLRTEENRAAWIHVNCAEWKNLFCFELFGRDGKLQIDGLGGSYGVERLTHYRMLPEMGPPETTIWEYPFEDKSWKLEFESFVRAIDQGTEPPASLADAKAALDIVAEVYRMNESGDFGNDRAALAATTCSDDNLGKD